VLTRLTCLDKLSLVVVGAAGGVRAVGPGLSRGPGFGSSLAAGDQRPVLHRRTDHPTRRARPSRAVGSTVALTADGPVRDVEDTELRVQTEQHCGREWQFLASDPIAVCVRGSVHDLDQCGAPTRRE
jgi:hypothetical protein